MNTNEGKKPAKERERERVPKKRERSRWGQSLSITKQTNNPANKTSTTTAGKQASKHTHTEATTNIHSSPGKK